jgi:hypothetical protein
MKPKNLKLNCIVLLLFFMGASCQKDDIFELNIGDKNAVIVQEVNGIEFKFCLLNEQGEPATVFNEGENFTFQFVVKNNTDTTLYYDKTLLNANGFCEVKDNNKSFGMPYEKPVMFNLIGKTAFSIPIGHLSGEIIKWIPDNDTWVTGFASFKKSNNLYLSKGKYHSTFKHKFDFVTKKTKDLTFKINFEIK